MGNSSKRVRYIGERRELWGAQADARLDGQTPLLRTRRVIVLKAIANGNHAYRHYWQVKNDNWKRYRREQFRLRWPA